MKTVKILMMTLMVAAFFAAVALVSAATRTGSDDPFDAAATYKTKCVICHGATAEKKFDSTKADADLVPAVLKGKKMEKPPNMPAYEEKGMTEDQAKAMVAFMKTLKP